MRSIAPVALLAGALLVGSAGAFEGGLHPYFSYTASGFGMGNAVVSLPAHPSNIWTNPAGLAFQEGYLFYVAPHDEVSGVHETIRDRVFAVSGGHALGGTFGGAFLLRSSPNVAFSGEGGGLVPVDVDEPTVVVAYGRNVAGRTAVGVALLGYQHRADTDALDGDPAAGLTAGVQTWRDHRLRGRLPLRWRFGLSMANAGTSFDVGGTEGHLPWNIRGGISAEWHGESLGRFTAAGDLFYLPRDEGTESTRLGGGIGAELLLAGAAAVRIGYVWDAESDRSDPTFGFGIGNEVYREIGGMIEYAHAPGEGGFADHLGVRVYYRPGG